MLGKPVKDRQHWLKFSESVQAQLNEESDVL